MVSFYSNITLRIHIFFKAGIGNITEEEEENVRDRWNEVSDAPP